MPDKKLSKPIVEQTTCPSDKSKLALADTVTRGLVLEVRRSGGRTFYFRYHDPKGRQRNMKIGDASVVTLETARQKVAEWQNARALGQDPAESRRQDKLTPRFDTFVSQQYLPYIQGYKRSWDSDESLLRNHLIPAFGERDLAQITKYELTCFMKAKGNAGLAPSTANRLVVLMRYLFNLALEWGVPGLETNPAKGIKLLQENNKKERFLTEEEVAALVTAVRASENPDLENIIGLLLMTGARKGEALTAAWDDIDFERRLWRVPKSKSGSARHIPLSDGALHLLQHLPSRGQSPYLFPNRKTGQPYKQVFHSWDNARRKAGLPELRIHDLRHSFASFLINRGRSLYEVQKLLGHHSIQVTERYAHLQNQTLIEAAGAAQVMPVLETAASGTDRGE